MLPYQLFREIETYDFEQNFLYQVLEEQYHIQITTTSLKLNFADGSPLCLTSTVLPYQLFREIETYDFEQNFLYQVLEEQYHIQITTTSLKLKAVSAYGNISRFIDVK